MIDWQTIIEKHGPVVWQTAYRLLGNRADAADCFQETFVCALEFSRRQRIRNFSALLIRLATVRAIDQLRKRLHRSDNHVASVDWVAVPSKNPGPVQMAQQQEKTEEDADPVWEQMKQEMFSPEEAAKYTPSRPEVKYDARKVKYLKSTLIKALVHTANIRGLKSDESVTLTVTGRAGRSSNVVIQANSRTNSYIVSDKNKNIISRMN